jgi:hypothetical protein
METPPYTLGERSGKGCSMKTAPRQLKGAHVPCTALRCHAAALVHARFRKSRMGCIVKLATGILTPWDVGCGGSIG